MRMTDKEAETMFASIRWADNNGKPTYPHCGSVIVYACRRPNGALRFRCKGCRGDFSLTSGTLFALHKLPLRTYPAAIVIFCNEVSALALSRDLDVQYKTAFVLAHKMREAMASEIKGVTLGGAGKVVEIDGMYTGGYIKPANLRKDRIDRRLVKNQNGKRKVVVVIRERNGRTLPAVFPSESAATNFIRSRVEKGSVIQADEANGWNELHANYEMFRINYQDAYSLDGACTNAAEEFFSRIRRAEIGHHHHISGAYLDRYAKEAAFREDRRRQHNGGQFQRVIALVVANKPSVDFCGYWQRSKAA
jgi:transposase-like protein